MSRFGAGRGELEEELGNASTYTRSLIEASLDPLVTISPEGKITDANQATELVTGFSRKRLIGSDFSEYFTEPEKAREGYRKVISQGFVKDYPLTIRHTSGRLTDVLYNAAVYMSESGKMQGVFAAARDITERKRAEQALQESQQMLQSVLDAIPVRVFWKDLNSNFLGCNRPFALDAGLKSPEEIIGRNDFELGWAEQAELYLSHDRLVMETGISKLGYEESQTTPDGGRIWLRTNKVPLRDAEGRIKGVLGTYEDITKSKQMEEMLRTSETKYRIIADNTYDWEYWVSPEGRFLYTSPSCLSITGYAVSEFETDPGLLSHIVHPDDLALFETHKEEDQTGRETNELEFRIIHRDGTTRYIGHLCQKVFDAQGRFLGRRGSNRDITDRKKAEKALEESAQKLKFFAYSVAHDLKSPAIGVYGLTKRLSKHARDVLDEKGRTYCDQILKISEHIAALVEKINIYIATKEAAPMIETTNLSKILRILKDEFSAQLSLRRIDWFAPEYGVEINADKISILRIFRNLIDNALKYGGQSLTRISVGYEESENLHIFSVSDNGKGLKEADSEKIFGLFQRNETSRGVEGAGLGLAIVKEIAEQHGGRVWVEPRGKKGITFYVSISKTLRPLQKKI
ncbi:MAG: PAS domain S-box protein [Syntrophobacteraceae bacterium]|jgi:PAS domain S-box-containing protein